MENIKEFLGEKHIADSIDYALKVSGSKQQLAKNLGVRYQTVLSWFRGSIPDRKSLIRIASFVEREVKREQR
jgi:hypothetical protein